MAKLSLRQKNETDKQTAKAATLPTNGYGITLSIKTKIR